MKVLKAIANVFGVLIALVLSLILTSVLITAPVISAATTFVQSETIHKLAESIDYKELLMSEGDMSASLEGSMDAQFFDELMKTEMVSEIIDLYVDGLFAVLDGSAASLELTPEMITSIGEKHADELVPILKAYIGEDIPLPDSEIRTLVVQMIKESAVDIASAFPSPEELGLDATVMAAISALRSGQILWAMVGTAAVLSILIVLFRCMRFKGFMWLGVVYLLNALIALAVGVGTGQAGQFILADAVETDAVMAIADPLLAVFSVEMFKGAGVLGGLAILFIAIFVVGRKILKNRAAAQVVEPVTESF